ncbi:MAG: DNA recombination protein RmuC [Flammeovirgaceae bacterium]
MEFLYLCLGIFIGGIIVWLFIKSNYDSSITKHDLQEIQKKSLFLEIENKQITERNQQLISELNQMKSSATEKMQSILNLNSQISSLQTQVQSKNEELSKLYQELKLLKSEMITREQIILDLSNKLTSSKTTISEYQNIKSQLQQEQQKVLLLSKSLSEKEVELKNEQMRFSNFKSEVEQIQQKFTQSFEHIANQILQQQSQKFTEQNKSNLDDLLKPLSEKLKDFEKKIEDTYDKESKQRFSLEKEIKGLFDLSQYISKEAKELTNALKGHTKIQGDWGETILERLLEQSGLTKNREYFAQKTSNDSEGNLLKPDIVVVLPQERYIIIDSKVSLVAYQRYTAATDIQEQENQLALHLKSIKKHIDDLSAKSYYQLFPQKSLDFVVMFMPIEAAYLLAVQSDSELWNYAFQKRILLVSPSNLNGMLKIIASLWRQEMQNKNAMEIARQGGELYDKFVGLIEDLRKIGERLKSTQEIYDEVIGKIQTGKGNLIQRAEKIRELGAKNTKKLPDLFIHKSENEANTNEDTF